MANDNITVEFTEKEIVNVELTTVDIVDNKQTIIDYINNILVENEIPTQLTARKFSLSNEYVSGSLEVTFNGIKEKYIIESSATEFSFEIDILTSDVIEVSYKKRVVVI